MTRGVRISYILSPIRILFSLIVHPLAAAAVAQQFDPRFSVLSKTLLDVIVILYFSLPPSRTADVFPILGLFTVMSDATWSADDRQFFFRRRSSALLVRKVSWNRSSRLQYTAMTFRHPGLGASSPFGQYCLLGERTDNCRDFHGATYCIRCRLSVVILVFPVHLKVCALDLAL